MARERASILETWIEDALTDPDKVDSSGKRLPCTALVLVHKIGTSDDEVHTIKLGLPAQATQYTPRTLAERFDLQAERYVRSMQGMQTFNLKAYYDNAALHGGRMIFTVMPPSFENGITTESPTVTGQLQQGMRHNDITFMQMVRHQNATNQILIEHSAGQAQYIRHLEQENRETFLVLKDAIRTRESDQHERDKELLATERTTKIIEQIAKYGPIVANMVTGRELFPLSTTDTTLVETIADKVTPDKMMKMVEIFGDQPAILSALMSRLETYHKQKAATETALQTRPAPGSSNGEMDAAGGMR